MIKKEISLKNISHSRKFKILRMLITLSSKKVSYRGIPELGLYSPPI